MGERDFEGTVVLEKLAEIGQLEAFLAAVDADDLGRARALLKKAAIDMETIAEVLRQIADGDEP